MTTVHSLSKFQGKDSEWPEWSFEARVEFVYQGVLTDPELIEIKSRQNPFVIPSDPAAAERASKL